jgi:hypothetical protein
VNSGDERQQTTASSSVLAS